VPWKQPETDDLAFEDPNAFLFSLSTKTRLPLTHDAYAALRLWKTQHLFFFGGGSDLAIVEHCD